MLRKKKLCKCGCGVTDFLWSKGYIKSCYFKLNKPKSIKKISTKGMELKKIKTENTKILHKVMYDWWVLFGNYKKCMACNELLPSEFSTANVDHLLPKNKYPELALDTNNFFLVCIDCHSCKENGFPKPLHKQAIENIKNSLL